MVLPKPELLVQVILNYPPFLAVEITESQFNHRCISTHQPGGVCLQYTRISDFIFVRGLVFVLLTTFNSLVNHFQLSMIYLRSNYSNILDNTILQESSTFLVASHTVNYVVISSEKKLFAMLKTCL